MLRLLPTLLAAAANASPYRNPDAPLHFDGATAGARIHRRDDGNVSGNLSNNTEPCAQVARLASQQAASGGARIDSTLALQCLRSTPLDTNGNKDQLLGVRTLAQSQSTVDFLKDPVDGYQYPAVDIFAGMDDLFDRLDDDFYDNEYDFQLDLLKLINSAHDGHFIYQPDITQVFGFSRAELLFSLSEDGLALPELYLAEDVRVLAYGNASGYTISSLSKINDQPVEEFLQSYADSNGLAQDPDANCNGLIYDAPYAGYNPGQQKSRWGSSAFYPGNETIYEFKNGSTRREQTFAVTANDFTGVFDGPSFFDKFCFGVPPTSLTANITSSSDSNVSVLASSSAQIPTPVPFAAVPKQTAQPAPPTYPQPWVVSDDGTIACYYPEEQTDAAILSVPSFLPADTIQFSNTIRQCLATSMQLKKKRLIIDLRSNGGGTVTLAFDMFKQLFPSQVPYGATNFRAFPLFDDTGKIITNKYEVTSDNRTARDYDNGYNSVFNANEALDEQLLRYDGWQDFYGPVEAHGANFTNLLRYNLSDSYDSYRTGVSGYGDLKKITGPQVFAAEDIVLLQDGACGSTCSEFAEFMKSQGHVKQIVMGGRAQIGPMQAVGSVKGANVYEAKFLSDLVQEAFNSTTPTERTGWNERYAVEAATFPQATARVALKPSDGTLLATVNIRNNIREGDESLIPLQFVYEAADCRLFYQPMMMFQQTAVWKATYDAQWGDGQCVERSTDQVSSGFGTDYIAGSSEDSSSGPGTDDDVGPPMDQPTSSATLLTSSNVAVAVSVMLVAMM